MSVGDNIAAGALFAGGSGSLAAAREVRVLQNGSLRSYLAYMLVTLIVALLLARPGGWW